MSKAGWLLVAAGCGGHPLGEVPIRGGTPHQVQVVRAALADFERWVGAGRIELGPVTFRPMSGGWTGRYQVTSRRVQLREDLEGDALRVVTHHELCHALDHQEDLLSDEVAAFDALVAEVRDDAQHPLHARLEGSERSDRSEILANLCERGPAWTHLLTAPCPGDPAPLLLAPAASWLEEEVWTGDVGFSRDAGPRTVERAGFSTGWSVDWAELRGAQDEAAVRVKAASAEVTQDGGSPATAEWRDVSTGAPVPLEVAYTWLLEVGDEAVPPLPPGLPQPPPDDPHTSAPVDVVARDGRALVVARRVRSSDWSTAAPLATRVWAWDGATWSVLDACPSRLASVFAVPDGLHLGDVDAESGQVVWSAIDW